MLLHPALLASSAAILLLLALAAMAFWPGYLSKLGSADRYTHVHTALGTCWLLLVQPMLISASHRSWHRLIWRAGALVGISFFISGTLVAHRSVARMNPEQVALEGRFVHLPLAMGGVFAVALLMAVAWRRTPAVHGRLMAATALPLLDPLLARLLFFHAPQYRSSGAGSQLLQACEARAKARGCSTLYLTTPSSLPSMRPISPVGRPAAQDDA